MGGPSSPFGKVWRTAAARLGPCVVLIAVVFALGHGAAAQDAAPPAELTNEATARTAIGRINHAGYRNRRHCTFFAIGPQVALTAAHCVDGVAPDRLHLLYGYDRVRWVAEGSVRATNRAAPDIAILCLEGTAPAVLGVGAGVRAGGAATVVGYGRPKVYVAQRTPCTILGEHGGKIGLDCEVTEGTSGGPLLDEEGRVVGVMSRSGKAGSIAYALPKGVLGTCS